MHSFHCFRSRRERKEGVWIRLPLQLLLLWQPVQLMASPRLAKQGSAMPTRHSSLCLRSNSEGDQKPEKREEEKACEQSRRGREISGREPKIGARASDRRSCVTSSAF